MVRAVRRAWRTGGSFLLGLAVVLALVSGAVALRLSQGPVELPFLAAFAERQIAARAAPLRVTVGGVVFTLGEGPDDPSGLRLTGVEIRDADGALLLAAPRMGARFRLSDAVRGIFSPTELSIFGADARITRQADGRIDLSLPGEAIPDIAGAAPQRPEGSAFADFVAAFEAGQIPLLRRLGTIRLQGIDIAYSDRLSGRRWHAEDGTVVLRRLADRLEGTLRLAAAEADGSETTELALDIRHPFGADRISLSARLAGARPDDLADQIPALGFLRPIEAPVSGEVQLEMGLAGDLVTLIADLRAAGGALRPGEGAPIPLTGARLGFHIDGRQGRLWLTRLEVATALGRIEATGEADIRRDGDSVQGLDARLEIAALEAAVPGRLEAPVAFDGGTMRIGLDLAPFSLRIQEASLARDGARFTLWGRVQRPAGDWQADLAFAAHDVGVRQVLALWPVTAAPGARHWVDRAMPEGVVEALSGHLRMDAGRPDFAMRFTYRDAVAYPLPGLPPITGAAGEAHLDLSRFEIGVEAGTVQPDGQAPIDLAGSVFAVPDLWRHPPEARVSLRGKGEIAAVLGLIDMPPLGLLGRIGARTDLAEGRATLVARLAFPLIRTLTPGDVAAEVEAELSDVVLNLPAPVPISAARLDLTATGQGMEIAGPLRMGPVTADFAWTQVFRPEPGEPPGRMTARFALTPALLAALGAGAVADALDGTAPARLTATLTPGGTRFALDADLRPASLILPGMGWRKPPGDPGRLELAGRLAGGLGGQLDIERIALSAGDLAAEGRLALGPGGRLASARLDRLQLGEALDTALDWDGTGLRLTGGMLDLVALGRLLDAGPASAEAPARTAPPAPAVTLALDRLVLTPRLALAPATGRIEPGAADAPLLTVSGPANGGVETVLTLTRADPGMTMRLTATDAGRFLRDSGYFQGGYGGMLTLDMGLSPDSADMAGRLVIRGITVRDAPVLGQILSIASITGVLETLTTGGLNFDRVEAHFRRADGKIWLTEGRATGGSLGITVAGEYDEVGDRLDLSGVFSPAYLLNGILGEVPLVGRLLTGERGEGVFGFSYRVRGTAATPSVSVNPLSILAPGVLRGVLTKEPTPPPESSAPELPAFEEERPDQPARDEPGRDEFDR